MSGFIEAMRDHILQHVPTDPLWAESVAIGTLSSVLRSFRFETKMGRLNLNLFILGVGPSGLAYKTTPLKYIAIPVVRRAQELINHQILFPKQFSLEGMVAFLQRHSSVGVIINDEFTRILKVAKGSGYMSEIFEFLSELYDGTMQKRYTKRAELEEVVDTHVSLISACSDYVYENIDPGFFVQGLGNRILYALILEPSIATTPDDFFDIPVGDDLSTKNDEFADALANLWNAGDFRIATGDDAKKVLADYQNLIRREAILANNDKKSNSSFDDLYLARVSEMCFKLAAIKSISDNCKDISAKSLKLLVISKEQADWATEMSITFFDRYQAMMKKWADHRIQSIKNTKTLEAEKSLIMKFVKLYGIISQQLLLKLTGFAKDGKYYRLIDTLLEEGRIRELTPQEVNAIPPQNRGSYGIGKYTGQVPRVFRFVQD